MKTAAVLNRVASFRGAYSGRFRAPRVEPSKLVPVKFTANAQQGGSGRELTRLSRRLV